MKKCNVLVTGVGAIIGYGIIRSLRLFPDRFHIVGMDIYEDAVGQNWCDDFVQAVPANSDTYLSFMKKLISDKKIDIVIPGIEQDVTRLSLERDNLADCGAVLVLNTPELIEIAHDKWTTYNILADAGFSAISTMIEGDFNELSNALGLPFLLKPRRSYASKGIQRIYSDTDLSYWRNKLGDEFMVQTIVGHDDDEYTVAVFGYGDGTCSHSISLRRKLSGEGATSKACVVSDIELDKVITALVELFRPLGPTNFQFRKHEGEYLLLEVNPRISSSTSLRTSFGYNEAIMSIEYFLHGEKVVPKKSLHGHAIRYTEDFVYYDSNPVRYSR
jgi:carbamoyl-phosphate synthase large subunit